MTFRCTVAPGVEIRRLCPSDAGALFAAIEANRAHLRDWLPWVDGTTSTGDVLNFLSSVQSASDAGDQLHAGIFANGQVAGAIGHHQIDWANRACSLGYWICQTHQGKGLVTRASRALLSHLFDERGLHRVEIRCGTGNLRSAAVPQRLGFQREGIVRDGQWVNDRWVDLAVWGLLETEWRQRAGNV